nr:MAG TPA: hypothetical protein [Caudoviricetes sp.]
MNCTALEGNATDLRCAAPQRHGNDTMSDGLARRGFATAWKGKAEASDGIARNCTATE